MGHEAHPSSRPEHGELSSDLRYGFPPLAAITVLDSIRISSWYLVSGFWLTRNYSGVLEIRGLIQCLPVVIPAAAGIQNILKFLDSGSR